MLAEECSVVMAELSCRRSESAALRDQPQNETWRDHRQPNTVVVGLCDETVAELADSTQALMPLLT